ncbi:MAG: hypothetical protein WDM94_10920 [Bauldia sp.]
MNAAELRAMPAPPEGASAPLAALWHAAHGEWDKAHALVQDEEGQAAAWVHAHLHRMEGDRANADYWYERAGKTYLELETEEEWKQIANAALLEGGW